MAVTLSHPGGYRLAASTMPGTDSEGSSEFDLDFGESTGESYPTSPLQEVVTHPAADDNNTDFSDDEIDIDASSDEDGVAGSNQVTRTVNNVAFSMGANESSSDSGTDVLLNKTETTYFGFDTDSNNSNVRGVPHAVSAPQQAYGQTTQNPTNEPNDAAEEDAADAKAPKTNSGGQEKSTSSSSKDDSRKESDWK
eukprot:gene12422-31173_t